MSDSTSFPAAVVACLCAMAVMARLAATAESSFLRLDPALLVAQTPSPARTSDGATTGESANAGELAKELSNPIASLISAPFQSNFDFNAGQDNDKFKNTLNIQPVIPLSLNTDWNLISRMRDGDLMIGTTECASCKIQMEQGTNIPTLHPLKLMAYSYGLMPNIANKLQKTTGKLIVS